jgi:predicted SAM-dependent methyltransferase
METRKLNLGCGGNTLEGFENHDADVDISKALPWKDESVDFILAEHVFEHVTPPDGMRFLTECLRILKRGGVLRLCVPVIGVHLKHDHARDLIVGHGHLQALDRNIVITMLWAAGFELPKIQITGRKDCDGHFRVIGKELDDLETLRIEAAK